ncbi:PREDICTED: testis-expressed sequence 13A protein [Chinchilla lanigera]|uniref:RanBP2-type domain-containing protein n=1 Tax=Chinchilla lanigera TaxID=34839 RepID=A0A8C2UMF0_CHILA|nr:PREDICTED: testis-expressed sequence 13A protein [Chinchilla lanigera]
MALKPEDPCTGFQHDTVVKFINKKMTRHPKGPKFYFQNLSLSWEEIEDKIKAILEDSEVPSDVQEACTWGSLALGMRVARRQRHLQAYRVQWLHELAKLHKSATQALASDLKQLIEQQEVERKEAAFKLWLAHAKLAQMQKERDLLRWKLVQAELRALPGPAVQEPDTAAIPEVEILGAGEKQEEAEAEASAAGRGRKGEEEMDVISAASEEATQELSESLLQLLEVVQQKNYTSGREREGDVGPVETATLYLSGTLQATSTASPGPLPVQLPASFTYSYSSPLSCFPAASTSSPLAATSTAPVPPQLPPHCSASNFNLWSDVWAQGVDPPEHQKRKRDSEHHQQRKHRGHRKPGDWNCPWCKAVNFSRRENCFRCRRGIWLQSP